MKKKNESGRCVALTSYWNSERCRRYAGHGKNSLFCRQHATAKSKTPKVPIEWQECVGFAVITCLFLLTDERIQAFKGSPLWNMVQHLLGMSNKLMPASISAKPRSASGRGHE